MPQLSFIFILLLTAPLFLASCASTRNVNQQVNLSRFPWQNYDPTLLVVARVTAGRIPDIYSRVFALSRIAQSAQITDSLSLGLDALQNGIIQANSIDTPLRRAELLSALSGDFIRFQQVDQAISLLGQAADIVFPLMDPQETDERVIQVLEDLIYSLFNTGPAGYQLLRKAVQRIYLIQNYTLRVRLLTRTAREYQQLGSGQRAGVLLQQALAGAAAISLPEERFEAYAQIALRFQEQGDSDEAQQYAQRALDLLQNLPIQDLASTQQETVRRGIQDLIRTGFAGEAGEFIQAFTQTSEQQELSFSLAEYYFEQNEPFAAELFLQQIFQRSTRTQSDQGQAITTLRIAGLYKASNDPLIAQYYIEDLINQLQTVPTLLDDFGKADLFVLAAELGIPNILPQVLDYIQTRVIKATALSRAIDVLGESTLGDPSAAADTSTTIDPVPTKNPAATEQQIEYARILVEIALGSGDQQDQSISRAALAMAKTGQYTRAVDLLSQISDPYTLSLTASDLSQIIPPSSQETNFPTLRSLLSTWDS